ncbi:MAG: hypothetical protein P9M12_02415 [Candidatus Aceula lacicola]|nr:hypothetical protein [Candidatus Aceula lacicola]
MNTNLNEIGGFSFFKTKTEKERVKSLFKFAERFMLNEKVKFIVPNMTKNVEGKIENIGFFVFFDSIILEFRNFLTAIDFDYTKWNNLYNIRLKTDKYACDQIQGEAPSITLTFLHGAASTDFRTSLTVFGSDECDYVYRHVAMKVSNSLK